MTEIVNLRRVRKRLAREKDARKAEENRALFGRTRGERLKSEAESSRLTRELDGAKLDSRDSASDASMKNSICTVDDT
ncbi:DUF4169 family protein [Asaia siamensis]|uniref:DUF4169 family protein n=1 Tax=Asaia siamensis TaxID=110479 RepID=A0ABQ1LD17_9PROT|nr:DUF4169 family protein [Asaia siamensis]GBR08338.1 hypothetical protein AA0323_2094 [Asaia siamensis NRIC 0323]GGC22987.1 hypothetical protein GCM10007207_05350 [Asaia siamensis]